MRNRILTSTTINSNINPYKGGKIQNTNNTNSDKKEFRHNTVTEEANPLFAKKHYLQTEESRNTPSTSQKCIKMIKYVNGNSCNFFNYNLVNEINDDKLNKEINNAKRNIVDQQPTYKPCRPILSIFQGIKGIKSQGLDLSFVDKTIDKADRNDKNDNDKSSKSNNIEIAPIKKIIAKHITNASVTNLSNLNFDNKKAEKAEKVEIVDKKKSQSKLSTTYTANEPRDEPFKQNYIKSAVKSVNIDLNCIGLSMANKLSSSISNKSNDSRDPSVSGVSGESRVSGNMKIKYKPAIDHKPSRSINNISDLYKINKSNSRNNFNNINNLNSNKNISNKNITLKSEENNNKKLYQGSNNNNVNNKFNNDNDVEYTNIENEENYENEIVNDENDNRFNLFDELELDEEEKISTVSNTENGEYSKNTNHNSNFNSYINLDDKFNIKSNRKSTSMSNNTYNTNTHKSIRSCDFRDFPNNQNNNNQENIILNLNKFGSNKINNNMKKNNNNNISNVNDNDNDYIDDYEPVRHNSSSITSSTISTKSKKSTQVEKNDKNDKYFINLEDLMVLEEFLSEILYNFFKDEFSKEIIHQSNVLELISIILCYYSSSNKIYNSICDLLNPLIYLIHQNFLILCDYLVSRITQESIGNGWVSKIMEVVLRKIYCNVKKGEHIHFMLENNRNIHKYLKSILQEYEACDKIRALKQMLSTMSTLKLETLSDFFKNKILVFENFNSSVLASVLEDKIENINTKVEIPFMKFTPRKPYTLVLDLDETLVNFRIDKSDGNKGILKLRPGLITFLKEMYNMFEIVIFTASTQDYADPILDAIEGKHHFFEYRLYRHHTRIINGSFVKDLSYIGRDISRTIIIDNMPQNFKLQKPNGIFIKSFFGEEKDDTALFDLIPILKCNIYYIILSAIVQSKLDVRKSLEKYKGLIFRTISSNFAKNECEKDNKDEESEELD